ncbi:MAG TPA: UDP-N-acetylmuramoyl-L-alanyl-D-glutamate--2,6-diaminopimelate ligase [Polyangiaceae bacterium]|jgi:UDP-N-acetylmuramoyl-L-alanyl-D-glutamate--2,6-diaminopimelate ligase|nr:UDP-N-acetylmuramoyl-L-alanyl-D-glutamate--2,6-diaminopimelate ligase [Polyangiaceae bacterium]HNZ25524.1 UDP-N-acetylmuramoyl-L-alanyl-D-glutamate--2,6-diaminopimelate ligase [Polyangiaceae bacterium]HOD25603.1 UDP-N-acetylmuramoyl-L-alanyl-D-glutamate--2,6-diaminopimelate ligase [Polyangiaceae bacterium]HOE51845.1 UDP-N-acetylmuramoyl-L-alanyl-D-glutamate--2,6-diaminopimelate ligase [Polyangiaceae bacterium]HOH03774.1 UDP-N-acetylmuramoyl-L-alanyl-D-glutamate--2,6-diaminopimelate ligase [P
MSPSIVHRPITYDEAEALEQAAAGRIETTRPTPPPYPWADSFFTVGVTGTNGKTSTTLLLTSIFRAAGHSVLTETTLGYSLDDKVLQVPRTTQGFLTAMREAAMAGARHAVIETTSQALARGYAKMWRFDLGVFTNLSQDHLAVHGSWEHYLASKAQLFVHLGPGRTAVLNAFDPACVLIDKILPTDILRLWVGVASRGQPHHEPDLTASNVEVSSRGTRVSLQPSPLAEQLGSMLEIPLVGEVFAENALCAAAAAHGAGCCAQAIRQGLRECPPIAGRFEIVHHDPIVVVDFAHTPDALVRTLDTARRLTSQRVFAVFGAGGERDRDKRKPMGRAVGQRADMAVVTNDNPRHEDPSSIARQVAAGCRQGGRAYVRIELDRKKAIITALQEARQGDVVVVAGKGHEQGQIIGDRTLPFSDGQVVRDFFERSAMD